MTTINLLNKLEIPSIYEKRLTNSQTLSLLIIARGNHKIALSSINNYSIQKEDEDIQCETILSFYSRQFNMTMAIISKYFTTRRKFSQKGDMNEWELR